MCSEIKFFFAVLVIVAVGCELDPDDRCQDGFYWDEDVLSCRLVEVDTEPDAGPDPDAGTDTDTNTTSGIGTQCYSDADCADFEANYCQLHPLEPENPGVCTFKDCLPGECPTGYLCCDCSNLGSVITCVDLEGAESAESYGCTCD